MRMDREEMVQGQFHIFISGIHTNTRAQGYSVPALSRTHIQNNKTLLHTLLKDDSYSSIMWMEWGFGTHFHFIRSMWYVYLPPSWCFNQQFCRIITASKILGLWRIRHFRCEYFSYYKFIMCHQCSSAVVIDLKYSVQSPCQNWSLSYKKITKTDYALKNFLQHFMTLLWRAKCLPTSKRENVTVRGLQWQDVNTESTRDSLQNPKAWYQRARVSSSALD
jgi:hypothetical protein